jgi:uncharacterized membrane protein
LSEQPVKKTETGLQENVAGLLCYLLGWITGIIFLILEPKNQTIRFHAWQSIFIFGAFTVLSIILNWIPVVGWILNTILGIAAFILWIVLIFRTYNKQMWKLPWAGAMADKQLKKGTSN